MNDVDSRVVLFDGVFSDRVANICDKECLEDYYLKIQDKIIEVRKLIAANLQNDIKELLNTYDKLNNDISTLTHNTLYIEGYKDGIFLKG